MPLFPRDAEDRHGFVRVVNLGAEPAEVRMVAVDDAGMHTPPVTFAVGGGFGRRTDRHEPSRESGRPPCEPFDGPGRRGRRRRVRGSPVPVGGGPPRPAGLRAGGQPFGGRRRSAHPRLRRCGRSYEPLELALGAGHAAHFNSDDLELGNADKGLTGSTGPGTGDWRLELASDLDIEVLAYVRTPGGFLTPIHGVVPHAGRRHTVTTFNPASNVNQRSRLRIVNPGVRPAHLSIAGVDDRSVSPGEVVRTSLAAGEARTLTAGGAWLRGRMGDGHGKWHLVVDCEQPITVMNLLESPTGHLTSLSRD